MDGFNLLLVDDGLILVPRFERADLRLGFRTVGSLRMLGLGFRTFGSLRPFGVMF